MRYLIEIDWPNEPGNRLVGDPKFGEKMQTLLKELKAETAYFSTVKGLSKKDLLDIFRVVNN